MMNRFLITTIFVFTAINTVFAGPKVTVRERFSHDTVWLGDRFELWIDVDKDMGQQIQIPVFETGKIGDNLELAGAPVMDTISAQGRSQQIRIRYPLTVFDAGVYRVPSLGIVYMEANVTDTVFAADSTTLYVRTFDIDTTTMKIADIKGPMDAPLVWAEVRDYVLWGGLAVVLVVGVVWFVVWWIKRRRARLLSSDDSMLMSLDPDVWALGALDELQADALWQKGQYKAYYSAVTDVVRRYVELQYGVPALEMTSVEILDALGAIGGLGGLGGRDMREVAERIAPLFTVADLVKFAKYIPQAEECVDAVRVARVWVEYTAAAHKIIVKERDLSKDNKEEKKEN